MLTRSVLATILCAGLVAGVGTSALAVAFVPGNESGPTPDVQAIAVSNQDPAEGTSSAFLAGVPVTVRVPAPIELDGPDEETTEDAAPVVEIPATEPAPAVSGGTPTGTPTPAPTNGNGNSNSGNGNGNAGNGNSGNSNGNDNSGSGNNGNGNGNSSDKDKKDKKDKKVKEDAVAETAE